MKDPRGRVEHDPDDYCPRRGWGLNNPKAIEQIVYTLRLFNQFLESFYRHDKARRNAEWLYDRISGKLIANSDEWTPADADEVWDEITA